MKMKLKNITKTTMKKIDSFKTRVNILNIAKKYIILNGWNDKVIDSIANEKKYNKEKILSFFPKGYISILEFYLSNKNIQMIFLRNNFINKV